MDSVGSDGVLEATVDNDLFTSTLKRGDRVLVRPAQVLDAADRKDEERFESLVREHGCVQKAALAWACIRRNGTAP